MSGVFLASRNRRKLAELERILTRHAPDLRVLGLDDVPAYDVPVEDAPTFAGNALLKAQAGLAATGLPTVADDSGLCVDALHGMPGVLSARWSGRDATDEENNRLLLAQLADVPDGRRRAWFECAIAFCHPNGSQVLEHGRMTGRVIRETRGAGGFGYDSLFVADEYAADRLTSAELSVAQKDAISHRGQALRALAPQVVALIRGA